ncbi:MAG: patatin-like phospholipase family protein [Chloroflexota bacterium]
MRKVGIALGGGGARGCAHIGVLYGLRKIGVKPDLVTGTSIGAVVAALIAFGRTVEEIHNFFDIISLKTVFSLPGKNPSLSQWTKFESLMVEHIGRPTFAEADIPLSVVATNLIDRQEVVLDEGDVISAVLGSMAFPILLPPVERNGLVLVDGGVVNNVPFDVARARGATFVVAVDLSNSAPYGTSPLPTTKREPGLWGAAIDLTKRRPIFQVMTSVVDIINDRTTSARLAISPPDIMIRPEINTIGLLDFFAVDDGITAGKNAVEQLLPKFQKYGFPPKAGEA